MHTSFVITFLATLVSVYAQQPSLFTVPSTAIFTAGGTANITWTPSTDNYIITIGIFLYRNSLSEVPVGTFQSTNFSQGFIDYVIPNDTAYSCGYFACMNPIGMAGLFYCQHVSEYFCIIGGPSASIPIDFPLSIVGTFQATVILPGMSLHVQTEGRYVQTCNSGCANVQALGSLNIGNGTAQLTLNGFLNGPCIYPNMTIVMTLLSPFTQQPSGANQATVNVFSYFKDAATSSPMTTGCLVYSTPAISYATKSYGFNFHIDTVNDICRMGITRCGNGWYTVDGSASVDYTNIIAHLAQLAANISGQTVAIVITVIVAVIILFIVAILFIVYCISSSNKNFGRWLSKNAGVDFEEFQN